MSELLSAYLIAGDDQFLVSAEIEKLRSRVGAHSVDDFSSEDDIHLVEQALATAPMFDDRRMVIVRNADHLSAEAQRALLAYLEHPSPFATLVLVAEGPAARLATQVKKTGRVLEARKGKPGDLLGWLAAEAKGNGLKISGDCMAALRAAVGDDRSALAGALDELALAFGPGRIGPEQVHRQFTGTAATKVWGLLDAVVGKDCGIALAALNRLMLQGEAPQVLLWALIRNFRQLMIVAERPAAEAAGKLGVPAWRVEKLARQARGFTLEGLVKAYRLLADADRKLKRSEEPPGLTLERTVVAITTAAI